uniref:Zinc finger C2HC domain-containing protein 1A n=1 Tax=Syphacia muris TaxID=451379 RepID=A0A0N5B0D1_9BILA
MLPLFTASSKKAGELPEENEATYPCSACGRRFIKNSLAKHEPVCKKMKKRKVFDSGKQRATGSDVTLQNVRKAEQERQSVGGVFPRPKTSWRERHESFVNAVSTSKQVDYNDAKNTASPPIPRTSIPKDYIKCDYCGRSFNQQAAERHIPFCREQQARKGPIRVLPLQQHQANKQEMVSSRGKLKSESGRSNQTRTSTFGLPRTPSRNSSIESRNTPSKNFELRQPSSHGARNIRNRTPSLT